MLFRCVVYVILRMNNAFGASFWIVVCSEYQRKISVLITYRRKAACTKCRCSRCKIVHNKCELLKCCYYYKHFDQIYNNIRYLVDVLAESKIAI